MRIYHSLEAARLHAHPGVYIMVRSPGPVWALMSVGERERVLNGDAAASTWSTVERTRPFHDVTAEADTGWHDHDIEQDCPMPLGFPTGSIASRGGAADVMLNHRDTGRQG